MTMSRRVLAQGIAPMIGLGLWPAAANADPWTLDKTFDDPTVTYQDSFGSSVAIDSDYVLIGAPNDDTDGERAGQAHLFDAASGSLLRTFSDPTPEELGFFGHSLAIEGNNMLVSGREAESGQVYLFDAATGDLGRTFENPRPSATTRFGTSLSLDGNNLLVGSYSTSIGEAYLFDIETGVHTRTFKEPAGPPATDFGQSVAIDGNYALIGAHYDGTAGDSVGRAHLYDATSGALLHTFDDPTPSETGDEFGYSVAIDGTNVLIGAPFDSTLANYGGQVHQFDATTGALLRTLDDPMLEPLGNFGLEVAIDGDTIVIGAPDLVAWAVARAYVFDAATGALVQTLDDPNPFGYDEFGRAIAIDGSRILIGDQWHRLFFPDRPVGDERDPVVGQAHLFTSDVPAVVPVPASLVFLLSGLFGLAALAFRHRPRSGRS